MKRLNTLFHIIKVTGFNQFLTSFVSFIFISGGRKMKQKSWISIVFSFAPPRAANGLAASSTRFVSKFDSVVQLTRRIKRLRI